VDQHKGIDPEEIITDKHEIRLYQSDEHIIVVITDTLTMGT
jgi:hypothetical protein